MGIEQKTMQSLYIDFVNLWVVAMYFLIFRNPVLGDHVTKVIFWRKEQRSSLVDDPSKFYEALKSYTLLFSHVNPGELDIPKDRSSFVESKDADKESRTREHKIRDAMKELFKERK